MRDCQQPPSRYRAARLHAEKIIPGFPKNLDGAALRLSIGASTLSRYEYEKQEVPAGLVLDMEREYRDEGLANWHCCNKCPIGIKKMIPVKGRSFENIAINLKLLLKKADGSTDRLLEIASDGKVNPWERNEFFEIVKTCCSDLQEFTQELQFFANQQNPA